MTIIRQVSKIQAILQMTGQAVTKQWSVKTNPSWQSLNLFHNM